MNDSEKHIEFYDVVIVGGGMVGAAQAQALLKQQKRVLLVESVPPKAEWLETVPLRVSAINLFSEAFLEEVGIWQHITPASKCMFDTLATWDSPSQKLIFSADEIQKPYLGHLIRNEALQLAAYNAFENALSENKLSITDARVQSIENNGDSVFLDLQGETSRSRVKTHLLIAADGANSMCRKLAGIGITGWDYAQHCFSITIKTRFPTQSITWQEFQPSGPKAFLPLEDGYACLIWYDHPNVISGLKSLSDSELKSRILGVFPPLAGDFDVIKHASFPLTRRQANSYFKNRVVLAGDAAHTINPLAGQGVNLGYKDVSCLTELLSEVDLSDTDQLRVTLSKYERRQKYQAKTMSGMMDLCYKVFSNSNAPLARIRSGILGLANKAAAPKKWVLKKSTGY